MRYVRKRGATGENEDVRMGYRTHNKVFNEDQERSLGKYLIRCADICYGLSSKEVRKLAYELITKYNLNRPPTWVENEMAGVDWFCSFMKRNPELSYQTCNQHVESD